MTSVVEVKPASDELLQKLHRLQKRAMSKIRLAKYVLCPVGLASDTVGDVTIDGKIALIQPHHEYDLNLCPLKPNPHPTELEAWFYSDCISYEHDIPVIVYPRPSDFNRYNYRFAYNSRSRPKEIHIHKVTRSKVSKHIIPPVNALRDVKLFYTEQLLQILGSIYGLKLGPLTCTLFRTPGFSNTVDLPFSKRYARVPQEIHLYATAQRQADTLSEFLCYYRVIESATSSNGVTWITNALSKIAIHDFGNIPITGIEGGSETKNVMTVYRRRALLRFKQLRKTYGTSNGVADYLYKVNRCGIAHGRQIVRSDIRPTYFEIVRDTYILKMLARLAIDERSI